jgi:hypothetical protein
MGGSNVKFKSEPRKRRYLVHLRCTHDQDSVACHYVANIQLWTVRNSGRTKTQTYTFIDEYELIETMNALLPQGSDVRDVLSHIENPDGFIYLLYLSSEEAANLGWRE